MPTTSSLILFEMTNDTASLLPLMAATVGGVYISHRFSPFGIYTPGLHRRAIPFPYATDGEQPVAKPAARPSTETAGA